MIDYKTLYEQTKTLSVLLVEDFEPLRLEMLEVLDDLFETVIAACDGEEALALYEDAFHNNNLINVVISDIQMPKMDGVVLTQKIREINAEQSIVILSAHTDSTYLIKLINMGIAQFLTKPIQEEAFFDILYKESVAKHKVQEKNTETSIINMGENYTWDSTTDTLKCEGLPITLTKHELILLQFLFTKVEQVSTRQNIIDYFYHSDIEISENNIRNLVFKLRKKIPEKCIINIYGLGYKFTIL